MTTTATRKWLPGQLARARNRDWVVLQQEEPDIVRLRPIDGTEAETVGIYLPLEPDALSPTEYLPPDPESAGDFSGARLLRDALRLNLRNGAGPFRSMGRLSVIPRPYQFVPLIMALRLDPVRLLIADDVGVGKTIEAGMIARELLDRGTVRRIGVLCPPHLCEQWEEELRTKFNIDTAVIQSSRISRLERAMPRSDVSLYQHYRNLVVSIDFAKSDRNRQHFLDNAPDLIIMDEAHTAARPRGGRGVAQQQRYALARDLAKDPNRHVILTTATPHSGIEEGFRSLLGLLNPDFDSSEDADLPKAELTPHLIQRKRADLKRWLDVDTPFPERQAVERSYRMSADYHRLYQDILNYCREHVASKGMAEQRQRVRYWAALSILRCVLSSPWAARAALENRRPSRDELHHDDPPGEGELSEELFGRQLVDSAEEDQATDYVPSVSFEDPDDTTNASEERRLSAFLRRAEALAGPEHDAKIRETVATVSGLLDEGYHPIVYCRFIQSAYYVADQLSSQLQSRHPGLRVSAATGNDGDGEQRKEIVLDLARHSTRVLVATDCLSEGVNLQEHYDAVIHYDLPWNPNRLLEQREGRVDRFGQSKPTIKTVLLYGADNEVDLVVLDVLLRKAHPTEHEQIPGPVSLVLGVIALHPSRGGLNGRPHIPKQLLGGLVKTHHRTLPVVLFVVKVQHVLHPGDELPAQLGDAPFLFLPRLEFVFLSIWRTVSMDMLPANSISTTLSASRWSVQFTCPSGGLLHAMATRCASCLPSNLRSRPGLGRSLMAASSPSSTNRFRTLATVAALTKSTPAISRSRSPSSALSNASAA